MKEKQVNDAITYWTKTAQHDYETMRSLFQTKRYSDCLFYGHIVLEKILKASVVRVTREHTPYIHDLIRLAQLAHITLSKETTTVLNTVNDFNIRARYPEYKLTFYKTCTKTYTEKYLQKIIALYKTLCQKPTQKK